jgi:moderate conductance mechanosensitive channel
MTMFDTALSQLGLDSWGPPVAASMRILFIVLATLLLQRLAARLILTFKRNVAARMDSAEQVRRTETLGRVARYVASIAILTIGAVLVLAELGISVAPILGAAGVVGLAVGFGAQSLVKDYFTGIFLLVENQLTRGDMVQIAAKSGVVEDLTLRYVRLRDYEGNVHFVPNNLITTVTNMSRGFAFAVIDVTVDYRHDVEEVEAIMRRTAAALAGDPDYQTKILEPFEYAGIEKLGAAIVALRGRFKVQPLEQWVVRREYLRRLKPAFAAAGIDIHDTT